LDRFLASIKEAVMSTQALLVGPRVEDPSWAEALQWAGAFVASFKWQETRRAYQRDLHCWFAFCAVHDLHPFKGVRRTHLEIYLRQMECHDPPPSNATLYRRIATLSSWFAWLEDEDVNAGNAAARVRRPARHTGPQPWLTRNELTDLLAAAEEEGGHPYALACLLGLNGLRVSEACGADITDLGGLVALAVDVQGGLVARAAEVGDVGAAGFGDA
jgi:integrase/recombinase XerD